MAICLLFSLPFSPLSPSLSARESHVFEGLGLLRKQQRKVMLLHCRVLLKKKINYIYEYINIHIYILLKTTGEGFNRSALKVGVCCTIHRSSSRGE